MHRSEIRYARAGEHHIAFREFVGDDRGDQEIVMVNGWNMPMEALPDDPMVNRLLEGLAALGRLIVFDRRGIALSDPVTDWGSPLREQWADDLAAVIEKRAATPWPCSAGCPRRLRGHARSGIRG
jgi:pimeloyl-ACP methyl ester carboxylesterase